MKRFLVVLAVLWCVSGAWAGLSASTGATGEDLVWDVTRSVQADYIITSPIINVATAAYVAVQVVCTSPAVQVVGTLPDMTLQVCGTVASTTDYMPAVNCVVDPRTTTGLTSVIDQGGVHMIYVDYLALRTLQFVIRYQRANPVYANRDYKIYVRVRSF